MTNPHDPQSITLFARTNFRGRHQRFGIRRVDRRSHMYMIGKTGTGKSTLLATLARQDIEHGAGLALLDPHGDLVQEVRELVPPERQGDLIYFDATDSDRLLGFNPLSGVAPARRPLVASGLLDVFRKLWEDSWGPRLEYILRHALFTLLDQPEASLGRWKKNANSNGVSVLAICANPLLPNYRSKSLLRKEMPLPSPKIT